MKTISVTVSGVTCSLAIAAGVLLGGAGFCRADQSTSVTLDAGTTSATVDYAAGGVSQWLVNGQSVLNNQSWYYSIGSGPVQSISTLQVGAPTIGANGANTLSLTYTANSLFHISLNYSLSAGDAANDESPYLTTHIRVDDLSSSSLDFHLYFFSDLSLSSSDQTVALTPGLSGKNISGIFQSGTAGYSDMTYAGRANVVEIGSSGALSQKLANSTALDGAIGSASGQDLATVSQWNRTLSSVNFLDLSIRNDIYLASIPEPSSLALLSLGAFALILRRRSA